MVWLLLSAYLESAYFQLIHMLSLNLFLRSPDPEILGFFHFAARKSTKRQWFHFCYLKTTIFEIGITIEITIFKNVTRTFATTIYNTANDALTSAISAFV